MEGQSHRRGLGHRLGRGAPETSFSAAQHRLSLPARYPGRFPAAPAACCLARQLQRSLSAGAPTRLLCLLMQQAPTNDTSPTTNPRSHPDPHLPTNSATQRISPALPIPFRLSRPPSPSRSRLPFRPPEPPSPTAPKNTFTHSQDGMPPHLPTPLHLSCR